MKKVSITLSFIALILIILFITESPILRFDRYGFGDVDWADGVYYNNQLYDVDYISSDHREIVTIDENMIERLLGKVKFTLNDNVSNMHYKLRNLDATFLKKGTKIYSIKNVDSSKSIAILDNGLYIKYSVFKTDWMLSPNTAQVQGVHECNAKIKR